MLIFLYLACHVACVFAAEGGGTSSSCNICELDIVQVFGDSTVIHTAQITKPPQVALSQQGKDGCTPPQKMEVHCPLEYFTVGNTFLPVEADGAPKTAEVKAVQPPLLCSVGGPCLAWIQQGAEDTGSVDLHLSVVRQVVVGPHPLLQFGHHPRSLGDSGVDIRLRWQAGKRRWSQDTGNHSRGSGFSPQVEWLVKGQFLGPLLQLSWGWWSGRIYQMRGLSGPRPSLVLVWCRSLGLHRQQTGLLWMWQLVPWSLPGVWSGWRGACQTLCVGTHRRHCHGRHRTAA